MNGERKLLALQRFQPKVARSRGRICQATPMRWLLRGRGNRGRFSAGTSAVDANIGRLHSVAGWLPRSSGNALKSASRACHSRNSPKSASRELLLSAAGGAAFRLTGLRLKGWAGPKTGKVPALTIVCVVEAVVPVQALRRCAFGRGETIGALRRLSRPPHERHREGPCHRPAGGLLQHNAPFCFQRYKFHAAMLA